jgi:hypothetical protein
LKEPIWVESYGRYQVYGFEECGFSWNNLIADNQKIVMANVGSCTWDWTFFDKTPTNDFAKIEAVRALREHMAKFPQAEPNLKPKIQELLAALE